jgi:hypothetical protein
LAPNAPATSNIGKPYTAIWPRCGFLVDHPTRSGRTTHRYLLTMENGLLLFPVAALHVEATGEPLWFRRAPNAHAAVISEFGDVPDVLMRLPESWCVVPGAQLEGLHDDEDIVSADPRFNGELPRHNFAVIRHTDRRINVALLLINAAEAVLLPTRMFGSRDPFEACVPGIEKAAGEALEQGA